MPIIEEEFDGWPTQRWMRACSGGTVRTIDTTRIEGNRIVLGAYAIHYDAAGAEIGRDAPWDNVTLYLH